MRKLNVVFACCVAAVLSLSSVAVGEQAIDEDTTWQGEVAVSEQVRIAPGATLTIKPGTSVTFKPGGGIRVGRGGVFCALGTKEKPVRLSGDRTGRITGDSCVILLDHCRITGVGVDGKTRDPWMNVSLAKDRTSLMRDCKVTDCAGVSVSLAGAFEMNRCDFRKCRGALRLWGRGDTLIHDNTIDNMRVDVRGGAKAAIRGNVIRGTVAVERAAGIVIEDNYIHRPSHAQGYGLVGARGTIRNNVIRGATWTSAGIGGHVTGNVFVSLPGRDLRPDEKDFTHEHLCGLVPGSRLERNIFVGKANSAAIMGIGNATASDCIIRNNTVDMRGGTHPVYLNHLVRSRPKNIVIRNNIFMRCALVFDEGAGPGREGNSIPNSIRAVDYNLWSSAGKSRGKTLRFRNVVIAGKKPGDAGFGGNDVPSWAEREKDILPEDVVVNPNVAFPFTDDEMLSRKHTVAEVLKHYSDAYTLKAGSPAIDAGDPAYKNDPAVKDGKPDIGAIEVGD